MLAAGTATGAGTSVALAEAVRSLTSDLSRSRFSRVALVLPNEAPQDLVDQLPDVAIRFVARWKSILGDVVGLWRGEIYVGFCDRLPVVPSRSYKVMVVQNLFLYSSSSSPLQRSLLQRSTHQRSLRVSLLSRWARWSLRKADLIVCQTAATAAELSQCVDFPVTDRIAIRPVTPSTPEARSVQPEAIGRVALLGDLYDHKRFDVAVEAVAAWAAEARPEEVELLWIGACKDSTAVRSFETAVEHARSVGVRVVAPGPLPHAETMARLSSADVLIAPSMIESQGLTVYEAMAIGVPVIARGIAPFIELGGDAVRFVGVDADGADFARALDHLGPRTVRDEMARRGRMRAGKAPGWDLLPSWLVVAETDLRHENHSLHS